MKTVFQRIRDAAKLGRGLGLSPEDVNALANIEEIDRCAAAHDRKQSEGQPELPQRQELRLGDHKPPCALCSQKATYRIGNLFTCDKHANEVTALCRD